MHAAKLLMNVRIRISSQALTRVDLVVIIALSGLFLGSVFRSSAYSRPSCWSNLKQVGIGLHLYANDHDDRYPVFTNEVREAWEYFNAAGSEINNPKVLLCPSDLTRPIGGGGLPYDFLASKTSFQDPKYRNNALSYFYGVDAIELEPSMFLAGDRNVRGGLIVKEKLLHLGANQPPFWDDTIHKGTGNVLFADGSVRTLTTKMLREAIKNTGTPTNRLAMP
jgi:prepilin-type processing-associated H-X9-DG protein